MRKRTRVLLVFAAAIFAAGLGIAVANHFAGPLPPRRFVFSTGREGGAYYAFAKDYQRILAGEGFTIEILPGPGSIETLQRLRAGEATVGFVQGGVAGAGGTDGLTALASVFYEPIWVFHRSIIPVRHLIDLRGRRVAVGEEGSGTLPVALQLFGDNGLTDRNTTFLRLTNDEAEAALREGRLDAALFVLAPRSDLVLRLLTQPGIELMNERHTLAYAGRHPYMSSVKLGEGVLDIARNVPREERTVLAVTANLVARADIHPDLVRLLLGAADRVHRRGDLLEPEGRFPSETLVELPLNAGARRYLRGGPPWLERMFPFWVAGLLDRTILVVIPMVTLMVPLFRLVLPLLERRHRQRLARWYQQLRECDRRCEALAGEDLERDIDRMRALQREVTSHASLPALYFGELYNLKMHISHVLARLEERQRTSSAS
jgi:uncharacterized protein